MNHVVVLGSGGREHALAMKLLESSNVSQVTVIPGNPGMKRTHGLEVIPAKNISEITEQVLKIKPTLTVIGPETYIEQGLSDSLRAQGLSVFGPSQKAGVLESSKIFSKEFMNRHGVPTAQAVTVTSFEAAMTALGKWESKVPPVVKCDSLAAGKGVVVAQTMSEAREAIFNFMKNETFSVRAEKLVLEERLVGREMSLFVLSDGKKFQTLAYACDHKRLLDNDEGPNTGGMGAVTPKDFPSQEAMDYIGREIVEKTFKGFEKENLPFQGVLFIGLMVQEASAQVIEYNVRFGDPETQVLLPNLNADLFELLSNCATGSLKENSLKPLPTHGVGIHVVMVSAKYPDLEGEGMLLGQEITLKDKIEGTLIFAGVKENDKGALVNSGGRVIGVTVIDRELETARAKAYQDIAKIKFEGAHYRRDIGAL